MLDVGRIGREDDVGAADVRSNRSDGSFQLLAAGGRAVLSLDDIPYAKWNRLVADYRTHIVAQRNGQSRDELRLQDDLLLAAAIGLNNESLDPKPTVGAGVALRIGDQRLRIESMSLSSNKTYRFINEICHAIYKFRSRLYNSIISCRTFIRIISFQ